MAIYNQIKPDGRSLAIELASKALRSARSAATARPGSVYIPNGDGTGTLIGGEAVGGGGFAPFVGDTTPPGRPTGVSATSSWGIVYIRWDGTLEGGVPADFAYVSVTDGERELGRFTEAGCISVDGFDDGERLELEFTAYDSAKDFDGTLRPNASGTAVVTVTVDNERTEIDAAVSDANEKADALQGQMDDVTATVDGVVQSVGELSSKVEGAVEDAGAALTAATEAKQTATEVSSTAERAYEDAQSALSQASSAVQTATQLQQTVTEDYLSKEDAAGTYAAKSDVTQTADEIRQEVSETYVSKEDADSTFTTKTEFEQTTEGISASVSQAVSTADGAMEKATTVEQTVDGFEARIEGAEKVATNYLRFDSSGLCVGNVSGTLQGNVRLYNGGIEIRNGTTVYQRLTSARTEMFNGGKSMLAITSDPAIRVGDLNGKNVLIDSSGVTLRSGSSYMASFTPNSIGLHGSGSSSRVDVGEAYILGSNTSRGGGSLNALGPLDLSSNDVLLLTSASNIKISTNYGTSYTNMTDWVTSRGKTGEWTWRTWASGMREAWLVHGGWVFRANGQTYTDFSLPWSAHNANYTVLYGLTNFASGSQPAGFTGAHFITTNATTAKFRANCWNESSFDFTCGVAIHVLDRPWG